MEIDSAFVQPERTRLIAFNSLAIVTAFETEFAGQLLKEGDRKITFTGQRIIKSIFQWLLLALDSIELMQTEAVATIYLQYPALKNDLFVFVRFFTTTGF